jgi:Tfp pilus assembly protein PilN
VDGLAEVQRSSGRFEVPAELLKPHPAVIPALKRVKMVDFILPESLVLKRRIEAPKKARAKLPALARLDLKRNTPIPEHEAIWTLGKERTEGQTVAAAQYVAKTADLNGMRRKLKDVGLVVRHFLIEEPDGSRLALDVEAAPAARGWRRLNAILAAAVLALGGYSWIQPALTAEAEARVMEAELQTLRTETVALRRQLETVESQQADADRLRAALQNRPKLVETLRNVTVALPDHTWLSTIEFNATTMTLSGETSETAADLVLELSKNRQFGNPRLSGPTTRTNTGREKFEIATQPGGVR